VGDSHAVTSVVIALAAGVVSQSLARHLRLPGIVVLLLAGVALGPEGLGAIDPRTLGGGFGAVVDLAVAIILFEGGLNLQISRLRREQVAIRRLVLQGAVLTLLAGAAAAALLLGWPLERALLFGSLVVVTGPTVIGPLVSELRLRTRVSTVLEAEGVLVDPVGAILAVLVLELVLAPTRAGGAAAELIARIGVGAAFGFGVGFALARLLRIRRLVPEGHENIFVLASVLLLFQVSNELAEHSGILAVTLAGVTVGNSRTPVDRDLREFKDQLTVLLIGLLFVMLAADVRYDGVVALGWRGLAVVAALILVVRPVVVAFATRSSDLSVRERLFIGWVAPRGIVAAAVASLVATAMEQAGIEGGAALRALVFLAIAGTVLQAGLTAGLAARWLGVQLPRREGAAILGAHPLSLLLAQELREAQLPVVFLDSNPQNCHAAEQAGFPVVFGNATEERTLQRARLQTVRMAIGLTPNQTVNGVFASRARELFGVPRAIVAVETLGSGMVADLVREDAAEVLFEGEHDVERWEVRGRHGEVALSHFEWQPPEEEADEVEAPPIGERFVMLSFRRGRATEPVTTKYRPKAGDRVAVAIHAPEREQALAALAARGWRAVEEEPALQRDSATPAGVLEA